MEQVTIEMKGAEPFFLSFIGDTHIGSKHTDEKLLQLDVESIQKAGGPVVFMGDPLECIRITDPRFDARELPTWVDARRLAYLVDQQMDRLDALLGPIRGQIAMWLDGNHDDKLARMETDMHRRLVEVLGIREDALVGYEGVLDLGFSKVAAKRRLRIYAHHGFVGGRKPGAKANALDDITGYVHADIYAMGHSHTRLVSSPIRLVAGEAGVEERGILTINTGTYLGRPGYSVRKGYRPQARGMTQVWYNPKQGLAVATLPTWLAGGNVL